MAHGHHPARLPDNCNIVIANGEEGSETVYRIGLMFLDRFKKLTRKQQHRNALYHIGTILLKLLIPSIGYYVFARLGKMKGVDKVIFYVILVMMRSPKLAYCELMLCYGFVRYAMPSELKHRLFYDHPGALLIGSRD